MGGRVILCPGVTSAEAGTGNRLPRRSPHRTALCPIAAHSPPGQPLCGAILASFSEDMGRNCRGRVIHRSLWQKVPGLIALRSDSRLKSHMALFTSCPLHQGSQRSTPASFPLSCGLQSRLVSAERGLRAAVGRGTSPPSCNGGGRRLSLPLQAGPVPDLPAPVSAQPSQTLCGWGPDAPSHSNHPV